jgi:hypothetical protein
MLRTLRDLVHSMVLRAAFCSQGEHKRETVCDAYGRLVMRCMDCGNTVELGPVYRHGTNRKVKH